ncbi:hypothetical protein [Muribaculum intestinale]|uniref:hypothetical protein n=1 Tax=Muribaculum intestinale TaxID=1796646 RepID=UPI0025A9A976|nr:hypothetical protein [Muribaculum intestinale]
MKTTEQKRAQAQRIVNQIDTRGDWVNRLYRFTQYLLKYHPDLIIKQHQISQ